MTMVSNSVTTQYLNPDCPVSSTSMDPGQSPLAMLAATCTKIGLPDGSKNGKTHQTGLAMALTKPDEINGKLSGGLPGRSASATSGEHSGTRAPAAGRANGHCPDEANGRPNGRPHSSVGTSAASTTHPSSAAAAAIAAAQANLAALSSTAMQQSSLNALAAAMRPAAPPLTPTPANVAFPYSGYSAALASLAAASSPYALPSTLYNGLASRPCTDPTCKTRCATGLPPRPCPAGCIGCAPAVPPSSSADLNALLSAAYNPFLAHVFTSTAPPCSMGTGTSSPMTSSAAAALPSSSEPDDANICNWVSAEGPCHRRFDTPEDLMKHLLTHTNRYHPYKRPQPAQPATSTSASASAAAVSSQSNPAASLHTPGLLTVPPVPFMPPGLSMLGGMPATTTHAAAAAAAHASLANYAALLYGGRMPGAPM